MVTRGREVKIYFSGDPSSAVRAFNTVDRKAGSTDRNLGTFSTRVGRTFAGLGRSIAVGVVGGVTAAGTALTGFATFAAKEAAEAQKVAAQTSAVIKSTGAAANVTAKDVDALAEALSRKSGVDDETIASGQNLLLTFTNLRNEAGRGNDIFDQATEAALDMSVALGTDLNSAAINVGKALNDPAAGVSKLTRVGVTFTEQQKAQIDAMVEAGDTAAAQRVILAELRKEFGGSAEAAGDTFAGQLDKLRNSFGNVAERVGEKLLPYLEDFADWVEDHMPQIEETITGVFGGIGDFAEERVFPAFRKIREWLERLDEQWEEHGDEVLGDIQSVITAIEDYRNSVGALAKSVKGDNDGVENSFNAVRLAVKVVSGGIRFQLDQWAGASKALEKVTSTVADGMARNWNRYGDRLKETIDNIVGWFRDLPGRIADALRGVGDQIADAFTINMPKFSLPWQTGGGPGNVSGLVGLGKALQGSGFHVGEHPAFGGVAPVHSPNSWHYQGRALDINWPGPNERQMLNELAKDIQNRFGPRIKELYYPGHDPYGGHDSHLHVAMAKGGIVTRPTRALIGEAGPEAVIPLTRANTANIGGDTTIQIVFEGDVVDERRIAAMAMDGVLAAFAQAQTHASA